MFFTGLKLSMCKRLLYGATALVIAALILTTAFFLSGMRNNLTTANLQYSFNSSVYALEEDSTFYELPINGNDADACFAMAQYQFMNLTTVDFLYDFEHMMRVLEEDWPFFELSISANGVDVHQLADEFRYILASADIDAIGFFELLREQFFRPIGQLGHLWVVNYPMFFSNSFAAAAHRIGELDSLGRVTPLTRHNANLARHLPSQILYDSLRDAGIGSQRTTEELVYETHILSDDTGLLTVNRMLYLGDALVWQPGRLHRDYYAELLYDFWHEIEGFDHLIIDLRSNPGGHICHFSKYVASMLVTSRTWLPLYVYFGDGHYSNIRRSVGVRQTDDHIRVEPEPVFHVDAGNLDFVFRSAVSWLPASFYFAWGDAFFTDHREPFAGKIWILTSEATASGAEAVTAMFLLNDLATVVGEPTWGVIGTGFDRDMIMFVLPNTGIQVRIDTALYKDHDGNYLQGYGLQPHYSPRDGMDALETVLAMIAEGAY